jgi:SAM-dependent methyltransferase
MSRRNVDIDDVSAWIFNRMADVYAARPAYPQDLIDAIAELADTVGHRIGDLGAGIGHLALPLAERGYDVTAVEPARLMLDRLHAAAIERGLFVRAVHAAAEALPLEACSLDLVLVADALHFIDTELAAREIARVLVPRGVLAVVTCDPAPTPFMQHVAHLMQEAAQRRPRRIASRSAQLAGVAKIPFTHEWRFHDQTPVTPLQLEGILASISFVGPAMNSARITALHERIHTIAFPAVWARTFTLRSGKRR